MRLRYPAVTVTLLLMTGSAAACSSSKPATASQHVAAGGGTVTGTLRLVGGPPPGVDRPASGEVYAFAKADRAGNAIAKVKTSAHGTFTISLPPGTYYLAATSPSFSIDPPPPTPPCIARSPAVVSRGSTVAVDVVCSMK